MDEQEYLRDCSDLQWDRKVFAVPTRLVRNVDGSLSDSISQLAVSEKKHLTRISQRRYLLNVLNKEVRDAVDDLNFISKCLQCLKGWFHDETVISSECVVSKEYQKRKDSPKEEKLLYGRLWKAAKDRDLAVSAVQTYSRFLLSGLTILHLSPTARSDDIVLLQIQTERSYSMYYPGLGLFCGNWKSVSLKDGPTHKDFYNPMNNNRQPPGSPYISFHESPSKLLTLQDHPAYRNSESQVVAFSLNALKQLGTEVTRTTDLLARTTYSRYKFENDGENFVHYANDSHWLVKHWAPEEAKLATLSMDEFRDLAARHNIINDDGTFTDIGACTIPKDAFMELERQKLSKSRSTHTSYSISEVTESLVALEIAQT